VSCISGRGLSFFPPLLRLRKSPFGQVPSASVVCLCRSGSRFLFSDKAAFHSTLIGAWASLLSTALHFRVGRHIRLIRQCSPNNSAFLSEEPFLNSSLRNQDFSRPPVFLSHSSAFFFPLLSLPLCARRALFRSPASSDFFFE